VLASQIKRKWCKRIALSIGALIALALGTELYMRIWSPVRFLRPERRFAEGTTMWASLVHVPSKTPGLTYEVAPNVDGQHRGMLVHTNSLGLRDTEPLPADTPHLVRIAAVGDSFTFGFSVDQGQEFPAQLEHMLNADEPGGRRIFDVLNFGVGGYSTVDEEAVVREKALPMKPDLVLLAYCLNDPEVLPVEPLQEYFADVEWWQHSELLRWIAGRRQGWNIQRYGGGNYFKFLNAPDGPCWPLVGKALDHIRDMTAERRVPVAFVILPMLSHEPWSKYEYAGVHKFVAEQARSRGFEVLDLMDSLGSYEPKDLVTAPDDPHFTATGNKIAAQAIEKFIRPMLASSG
jgi:lysophospholipase L1-like esterase